MTGLGYGLGRHIETLPAIYQTKYMTVSRPERSYQVLAIHLTSLCSVYTFYY